MVLGGMLERVTTALSARIGVMLVPWSWRAARIASARSSSFGRGRGGVVVVAVVVAVVVVVKS